MDVWYAGTQYERRRGVPQYEELVHAAISSRAKPFTMQVPNVFLPWDPKRGLIAIRRKDKQLAVCRCGVVLGGVYFPLHSQVHFQVPVALKVMDRRQVQLQQDDITNEIRIMNQLQTTGIDSPLTNAYVIRWEYREDQFNQYIATELVANGSLVSYAHKRIRKLMTDHLQEFIDRHGQPPTRLECVSYVYRATGHVWMREAFAIFNDIIRGLTYMHAQGVSHLDLDIYNIAIDKECHARIIDFGSSQLMDHRGYVGAGDVGIKCKPAFVSPEMRAHARLPVPRPGFDGACSDLWSAGVILVQCVVWGFRGGPSFLMSRPNWRQEIFAHIKACCDATHCHFCENFIVIPPLAGAIITQLLHEDPKQRPSAFDVAMAIQRNKPFESLRSQAVRRAAAHGG